MGSSTSLESYSLALGIDLLTLKQMNKMNRHIYLLIYFLLFAMVIKANGFVLVYTHQ